MACLVIGGRGGRIQSMIAATLQVAIPPGALPERAESIKRLIAEPDISTRSR